MDQWTNGPMDQWTNGTMNGPIYIHTITRHSYELVCRIRTRLMSSSVAPINTGEVKKKRVFALRLKAFASSEYVGARLCVNDRMPPCVEGHGRVYAGRGGDSVDVGERAQRGGAAPAARPPGGARCKLNYSVDP